MDRHLLCVLTLYALMTVIFPLSAGAQQVPVNHSNAIWTVGGGWGEAAETGFEGARWWTGSAVEIRAGRLSYHAKLQYSPAAELAIQGGSTFWFRKDYGITGNYVHNWFWSRQYNLQRWDVAPGFAWRPGVLHVERFYASYFMPTGCVWATAECLPNPVKPDTGTQRPHSIPTEPQNAV